MMKKYINYLYRSKKALTLFILLAQVTIYVSVLLTTCSAKSVSGISGMYCFAWALATALSFVLPFLFLHFVNNKKALDVYMTLPLDRKTMILTNIIYMFVLIVIPQIIFGIINVMFFKLAVSMMLRGTLIIIIYSLVLIIFNTGIYLIGNNMIDCQLILIGYSSLPFVINLVFSAFNSSMVVGIDVYNQTPINCISLIGTSINYLTNMFQSLYLDYVGTDYSLALILCLIGYLLIGLYSIKKNFLDRKMERAESISDNFFGYRLLINVIFACLILAITLSFAARYTIANVLTNCIVWYITLIILYIITTFIYKRKFELKPLSIIYIVLTIVLSNGFAKISYDNEGFGLSYEYDHNPINMMVNGYGVIKENGEILQYTVYEDVDDDYKCYYDFNFDLRVNSNSPIKEELINYINNARDESIKRYFDKNFKEDKGISLSINTNYNEKVENYWLDRYDYASYSYAPFSINDLKMFAQYGAELYINKVTYNQNTYDYEYKEITFNELLSEINKGA